MLSRDREFLCWLHERLVELQGENPLCDYMHRLRQVIHSIGGDRETARRSFNSLAELREHLRQEHDHNLPAQPDY
jgi:hypothetical protein